MRHNRKQHARLSVTARRHRCGLTIGLYLALLAALPVGIGCSKSTVSNAPSAQQPSAVPPRPVAEAAPVLQPPAQPKPILRRTTQDIRDAETERAKGAEPASAKITGQDPITISGSAYITIIGKTAKIQIDHSVDLWHAEHGRYPKDYDEFMSEIVKKNGIRLPELPYYQKYAYDAANHCLIVLEYPH
jgi:hypothetical protein